MLQVMGRGTLGRDLDRLFDEKRKKSSQEWDKLWKKAVFPQPRRPERSMKTSTQLGVAFAFLAVTYICIGKRG